MTDSGEPDNSAYDRHMSAALARDLHARETSRAPGADVAGNIDFVTQVTALPRARRILQIGCGSGEHAFELARRGHKIVVADSSTPLVEYARAESRRLGTPVAFLAQDFRELEFPPYFDLILNFHDEAPLALESDEAVQAALGKIRDLLRPGGQFLFGRADFRLSVDPHEAQYETTVGVERHTVRFDPASREVSRTIILEGKAAERPPSRWMRRYRLYTLPEVAERLETAGLAIRGLWHAYETKAVWTGPEQTGRIILAERVR